LEIVVVGFLERIIVGYLVESYGVRTISNGDPNHHGAEHPTRRFRVNRSPDGVEQQRQLRPNDAAHPLQ
jgi:hypothetical protein